MSFLKKMGRNLQSSVNSAMGKQATKETEEMLAKFAFVVETKKNFKELLKLWESVFARTSSYNDSLFQQYPADPNTPAGKVRVPFFAPCAEFLKLIKDVEENIEKYEQNRQRWDDATNAYNGKVSGNKPADEQEKFRVLMDEAKFAYDQSREPVVQGHAILEGQRAGKHAESKPVPVQPQQQQVQNPDGSLQYRCANCQTIHGVAPGTPKFVCGSCGVENEL